MKSEPEFHDIGDSVILLKSLEIGFVVGIDDQYLMVKVKSSQEPKKVQFADAFNKKWNYFLKKTVGDCWDLNISYYSPSHYIKAIDLWIDTFIMLYLMEDSELKRKYFEKLQKAHRHSKRERFLEIATHRMIE